MPLHSTALESPRFAVINLFIRQKEISTTEHHNAAQHVLGALYDNGDGGCATIKFGLVGEFVEFGICLLECLCDTGLGIRKELGICEYVFRQTLFRKSGRFRTSVT